MGTVREPEGPLPGDREGLQALLWLTPQLFSLGVPEAGVVEALESDSPPFKFSFLPWYPCDLGQVT